jgi:hypothetical protein
VKSFNNHKTFNDDRVRSEAIYIIFKFYLHEWDPFMKLKLKESFEGYGIMFLFFIFNYGRERD